VETLFFSALIKKDGDWYVARCMDLDVTSQGKTVEEAKTNLKEALELYIESFGSNIGEVFQNLNSLVSENDIQHSMSLDVS
jgi:predicted RNase H-like HicB family nuclease